MQNGTNKIRCVNVSFSADNHINKLNGTNAIELCFKICISSRFV